jgi:hypothetical protein
MAGFTTRASLDDDLSWWVPVLLLGVPLALVGFGAVLVRRRAS